MILGILIHIVQSTTPLLLKTCFSARKIMEKMIKNSLNLLQCAKLCFFSVTFSMASTMKFYFTNILMKLFEGYKNVDSVQSFWKYAEGDLLNKMYWDFDYGAESGKYECPTKGETSIGPCRITREDRNILYENKLLGLPR